jgi:hypothetical protein
MQAAIIGDSFSHTYKNTWIETVCNELDLQVIHHRGFNGGSQYEIYLEFLEIVKNNPDVIICCYTEHSRLYHPKEIMHKWFFDEEDESNLVKDKEVLEAGRQYYFHFYDENFSRLTYAFMIEKMQKICKERNIKLINIPCFEHNFVDKTYGLWLLCDGGLVSCSRVDYKREYNTDWVIRDPRLNHFSPTGHQVLANNIIPHIKTYINTDQESHTVLLFPELFA